MNNNYKRKKEGSKNNKGFYISLGVCLVAITAAAIVSFGNFDSFKDYENEYTEFSRESHDHQTVDNIISGVQDSNVADVTEESNNHEDEEIRDTVYNTLASINEPVLTEQEYTQTNLNETVVANTEPSLCIYPSSKNVIKPFSNGNPVYSITLNDWRVHDGVDFAAEKGSIIKSITDGVVKDVYTDQNLGKVIVIEHTGEFEAHYCGLGDTTLVNPGDHVVVGQDIGSVKSVPCEILEQEHLHLAIRKGGVWINPMQILENAEESIEIDNN